ncbi:hypothetical protein SCHPADRAFT_88788 [Schizopora paradoxa]|uniref:Ribosomal protein 60S n=1 Tax=Schizopora paradoxa TaxID=27342 RepID=A0A0H2SPS0_9AGAM|nr:hypothetical protein SCHPADRAFT_88788 [Schizopora paradoxa]
MRHIAAYLLLQIGGNTNPSAEDVKRVLAAVGIEADESRLIKLIQELEGKDINKVSSSLFSGTVAVRKVIESGSKELIVLAGAPSSAVVNGSEAKQALEQQRSADEKDGSKPSVERELEEDEDEDEDDFGLGAGITGFQLFD